MPYAARILVPTDFSPLSAVALDHALAIASLCHASIHLIHVEDDGTKDIDDAAGRLATLASRCQAEALVVTSQVCGGRPAAAIVNAATDRAADLIVLGTHGRRGVAHLVLGSVAEQVVRSAPCPVLTVRGHIPERVANLRGVSGWFAAHCGRFNPACQLMTTVTGGTAAASAAFARTRNRLPSG